MFDKREKIITLSYVLGAAISKFNNKILLVNAGILDNEFFYDIDGNIEISELEKINEIMVDIIKNTFHTNQKILSNADAKAIFKDNPHKIDQIKSDGVNIIEFGDFIDISNDILYFQDINTEKIKIKTISILDNGNRRIFGELLD